MGEIGSWKRLSQNTVRRVLDVNLDRAREGLRIIEEWCRFGMNNASLTEECKNLRQELAAWHTDELRAARNTPDDPGIDLTHPQEAERSTIQTVLQANFCRVQEALRVLEEYGKVYHPGMGQSFKQMRYRVYTLESQLLTHLRQRKLEQSLLYLVTTPCENLLGVVEAALQSGLTLVQYRDKGLDDGLLLANARKLCELCHSYDALFIMNDRVDIAVAVDADGVHLGQQDMPLEVARQLIGPHRLLGCSTTNPDEMQRALQGGADYLGVGPVYETPTKPGKAAAGLDYVRYAVEHSPLPWYAIGGIDVNNVNDVIAAGAQRIAVVRSIMQSDQPSLTTQYFVSQLNRVQIVRRHAERRAYVQSLP